MKKLGFLITMLVFTSLPTWSQGAKSIRITEVMTNNRTNLVDEYGLHKSWVELSNSSFTTYNVRSMFLPPTEGFSTRKCRQNYAAN